MPGGAKEIVQGGVRQFHHERDALPHTCKRSLLSVMCLRFNFIPCVGRGDMEDRHMDKRHIKTRKQKKEILSLRYGHLL